MHSFTIFTSLLLQCLAGKEGRRRDGESHIHTFMHTYTVIFVHRQRKRNSQTQTHAAAPPYRSAPPVRHTGETRCPRSGCGQPRVDTNDIPVGQNFQKTSTIWFPFATSFDGLNSSPSALRFFSARSFSQCFFHSLSPSSSSILHLSSPKWPLTQPLG